MCYGAGHQLHQGKNVMKITKCWNCNKETGFGKNKAEPNRYDTIICSTACRKVLDKNGWKPSGLYKEVA